MLRSHVFLYGENAPEHGVGDIEWWDERGQQLSEEDWGNPDGRALSMRRAVRLEDGRVEAINLLLNASDDAIHFALPRPFNERMLLIDSARPELADVIVENDYSLEPHSAVLIRSLWDGAE